MTEPLSPRTVAALDQATATLAALVRSARLHHRDCQMPTTCPGPAVNFAVVGMSPERALALLGIAASELARRGYGEEPVADPVQPAAAPPAVPVARPDVWRDWSRRWPWQPGWRWCTGTGPTWADGWAWTRAGAHRAALLADAVAAGNAARARAEAADG